MKLQKQIKTAAALALSALAVAGPAAAGTPLDSYRDGPERHSALTSAEAAIAYFYANERSQGPVASKALVGYVDGPERGALLRSTTPVSVGLGSDDGGFDWGAAAVGATSVLMFGLLIGGSLSVKHFRGGRLTH